MYQDEVKASLAKLMNIQPGEALDIILRATTEGFILSIPEGKSTEPSITAKAIRRFNDCRDDKQFDKALNELSTPWHVRISLAKVVPIDIDGALGMMEAAYAYGYDHEEAKRTEPYVNVLRRIIRLNNHALDRP